MRYKLTNGTDAEYMALYDRAALPDNYDIGDDDPQAPDLDILQVQGMCAFVPTDGDDEHWLHLYIDENAPDDLQQYSTEHITLPQLKVPSGKLFYTGCEFVGKEANVLARKFPQMLEFIDIGQGSYRADIHFLHYPYEYLKAYEDAHISEASRRALRVHKTLGFLAVLGVCMAFLFGATTGLIDMALCLVPLLIWLGMTWNPAYTHAEHERDEAMSELPHILAHLEKNP